MFLCSRPARQRGTSGGVWSWGGIARRTSGSKGSSEIGRWFEAGAARRRSRVDAALSPGRHSPGALRVPRLPGTGAFPGAPPGLGGGLARPILVKGGSARMRLRLLAGGPKREARDQGAAERGVSPGPGPFMRQPGPWAPWPCRLAAWNPQDGPLFPPAANPQADPLAPRTRPGAPRARPSLLFRGSRPSRPSCLGPDKGRENEDACLNSELHVAADGATGVTDREGRSFRRSLSKPAIIL
jgi:hypothetical protein